MREHFSSTSFTLAIKSTALKGFGKISNCSMASRVSTSTSCIMPATIRTGIPCECLRKYIAASCPERLSVYGRTTSRSNVCALSNSAAAPTLFAVRTQYPSDSRAFRMALQMARSDANRRMVSFVTSLILSQFGARHPWIVKQAEGHKQKQIICQFIAALFPGVNASQGR
jgi:hypothetical protein